MNISNLRYYRKTPQRKLNNVRIIVLLLIGVIWVGHLVSGYKREPSKEEHSFALMREADVALRTARLLEDKSWLQTFALTMLTNYSFDKVLDQVLNEFSQSSQKGLLDADGITAYGYLRALKSQEAEYIDLEHLEKSASEELLWSWEAEVLKRYSSNLEYHEYELEEDIAHDQEIYACLWWRFLLNAMVFFVGLPFLPAALRCFQLKNIKPVGIASSWDWKTTLTIVLLVGLCGDWLFYLSYLIPDSLWNMSPIFFEIIFDSGWRCIPAVALIVFLRVRWRHLVRVLDLDKMPHLKVVLGMMCLAQVFDHALFFVFNYFDYIEWATINSIEDGLGGLLLAFTSAVIFAPIMEEIEFRGFLFRSLQGSFPWQLAMVVSTAFFVSIHYYDVYGSISVASFGIVACPLYLATRSLWTPIIYHALTNLLITMSFWPLYHGIYS